MMQPTGPSAEPSLPESHRPKAPPGPRIRNLAETVWTKLDRKATAIVVYTLRVGARLIEVTGSGKRMTVSTG